MFLRMFVCVFFPVLCCFVPSLYDSLFKYEMLFSDKERMDGNTTKGKFVHLVHYFCLFSPLSMGWTSKHKYKLPQQNLLVPHTNFPATNTEITVKERYTLASFYFYPDFKQSSIHYIHFEQQFRHKSHLNRVYVSVTLSWTHTVNNLTKHCCDGAIEVSLQSNNFLACLL